jgi:glycosyltransferase involved in cell wall biosynthesis
MLVSDEHSSENIIDRMNNLSEVRLSVALVTRNRPDSLNRCLESLRSQSVQPFEVIISDDSDPEFAPATEAIAKHWDCRYITGPRRGLYANRNHAALACQGTHIRTMDDDHEFPENHFQIIQKVVESAPNSIWIIGEYWEQPTPSSTLHAPGEIQPRGFSKLPRNLDDCFAISDGSVIYPKEIFEHHRYLEVFKFGSLYLEFGARLKALGYRIQYCPETFIIHHYIPGKRSFNDENLSYKSAFLAAYMTYGCYFPSLLKKLECLAYFLVKASLNTINLNHCSFNIMEFWRTWQLGESYKRLFQAGKYKQIL